LWIKKKKTEWWQYFILQSIPSVYGLDYHSPQENYVL